MTNSLKSKMAELMEELGFKAVAKDFSDGKHSGQESFRFIFCCLKANRKKQRIAKAAMFACQKENL